MDNIITAENFPYPDTNEKVIDIALTYDRFESVLMAGDVSFLLAFDVTSSTHQFFIETDVSSKILVVEYDRNGFSRLYITNSCTDGFYNMIGSVTLSALTAQQFSSLTRHRGKNIFPVSRFEERKGE